ncbi:sigma-70 family RNA polymerase sigma factor, partial [Oceanobacillus massiliensis]
YVYVKNKDDALDVMQETAYRSLKNLHSLRNPEFFKTWITRITINCAMDLLRRQKKLTYVEPEQIQDISYVDDDIPLNMTIHELMNNLHENEKTIIILKFYSGYNFREISNLIEMPHGTVKSVYYRALIKLRKQAEGADLYGQYD